MKLVQGAKVVVDLNLIFMGSVLKGTKYPYFELTKELRGVGDDDYWWYLKPVEDNIPPLVLFPEEYQYLEPYIDPADRTKHIDDQRKGYKNTLIKMIYHVSNTAGFVKGLAEASELATKDYKSKDVSAILHNIAKMLVIDIKETKRVADIFKIGKDLSDTLKMVEEELNEDE